MYGWGTHEIIDYMFSSGVGRSRLPNIGRTNIYHVCPNHTLFINVYHSLGNVVTQKCTVGLPVYTCIIVHGDYRERKYVRLC